MHRIVSQHQVAKRQIVISVAAVIGVFAHGKANAVGCTPSTTAGAATTVSSDYNGCYAMSGSGSPSLTINAGVTFYPGSQSSTFAPITVASSTEGVATIVNAGTVKSDAKAVVVEDAASTYLHSLSNSGTIIGVTHSALVSGASGRLSINNSGELIGSLNAGSGTINILNSGVVTLKSNVNLNDVRNSGGIVTASLNNGSFTQTSAGTLRVAIVSTSAEGSFSTLTAGSATLAGTLDVDVKAGSGLAVGGPGVQSFRVVDTSSPLSGQFAQVTDNSALFNFQQRIVNSEDVYIDVVRANTAESSTQSNNNPAGQGAARVFDQAPSGLQTVLNALGQLSTTQEVSNAVTQTLPLLGGGATAATQGALSSISRVVQARIEGNQGISSGDEFLGDRHVWAKPFGSWANQKDVDNVSGYDARSYGLVLGVDGILSPTWRVGAALAYANAQVESASSAAPQSSDIDVFQLIAYGSYTLNERTELSLQADIGSNRNQGKRPIPFMGLTARSTYDSLSAHFGAGLGHTHWLSEQTTLTATARADYTWIRDEGYGEKDAGVLNLRVKARTSDTLIAGVEGKLAHKLDTQTQLTANAGLGYDLLDERSAITAAFAGAPDASFVTHGLDLDPWLVRAGFGVVHATRGGVEITARYDAEVREKFLNQTASVKFRWAF